EVVELADVAQGEDPELVHAVAADAVVSAIAAGAARRCLGCGAVSGAWGGASQGAVRSALVVVLPERVELRLHFRQALGGPQASQALLERLVETLDLALGGGVPGVPVLLPDTQVREQLLEGVLAAHEPGGVNHGVISQG